VGTQGGGKNVTKKNEVQVGTLNHVSKARPVEMKSEKKKKPDFANQTSSVSKGQGGVVIRKEGLKNRLD